MLRLIISALSVTGYGIVVPHDDKDLRAIGSDEGFSAVAARRNEVLLASIYLLDDGGGWGWGWTVWTW